MLHLGSLARHGCACSLGSYKTSPWKVTADVIIIVVAMSVIGSGAILAVVFGLHAIVSYVVGSFLVASGVLLLFSAFVVGMFLKGRSRTEIQEFDVDDESVFANFISSLKQSEKICSGLEELDQKPLEEVVSLVGNRLKAGEYIYYLHISSKGECHLLMQRLEGELLFSESMLIKKDCLISHEELYLQMQAFRFGRGTKIRNAVYLVLGRSSNLQGNRLNHILIHSNEERNCEIKKLPIIHRFIGPRSELEEAIKKSMTSKTCVQFILALTSKCVGQIDPIKYYLQLYALDEKGGFHEKLILLGEQSEVDIRLERTPKIICNPNDMPVLNQVFLLPSTPVEVLNLNAL